MPSPVEQDLSRQGLRQAGSRGHIAAYHRYCPDDWLYAIERILRELLNSRHARRFD